MSHFLSTAALFLLFGATASGSDNAVWQLHLEGDRPTNCQLPSTRIISDEKGKSDLQEDTRPDKNGGHSCIVLPKGLLKAAQDYVVTHQVIQQPNDRGYFYVFARFTRLGYGADQ